MLKYGGPTGKTVTKVIKENITQEECTNQLRGDTIVRFEPNPEGKKAILNPRAAGCQDGRCGSGAEGLKCPGTTSGFCICDRYKVCH